MKELLEALSKFQDEVVFVKAKRQANYGKYAQLKDIVTETRPALKKNGLFVVQALTHIDGTPAISTQLSHSASDQVIETKTPLIHKPEDPQKWGAAITYARRYSYVTILGLLVDEDDDGQLASVKTEAQPYVENIEEELANSKTVQDLAKLFNRMPPQQRVETTKAFTARKLEINNGSEK